MCHFSVRQRHPLSQLTNYSVVATKVIAQSHGLILALLLRLNAAPLQREWEVLLQSLPTERTRVDFRSLLAGH